MTTLAAFQERLGYAFRDEKLLRAALTHPSLGRENKLVSEYERLEFLGDRALGLVIAEWLFELFDKESEGSLAKRHAALVNRDTLAEIAEALLLQNCLRLAGEGDLTRGRVNILSDAMEAVIGALFREGGMEALRPIIRRHWQAHVHRENAPQDAKSALQEWAQGRGLPLPEYKLLRQSGPAHAPTYVMEVRVKGFESMEAEGTSKREAEKKAAALLWGKVRGA